jgi:hypothetical protein
MKRGFLYFIFAFLVVSLQAQETQPNGRLGEEFNYPLKKFGFVSPRYSRTNFDDGKYLENYFLRSVFTFYERTHLRFDIPVLINNNSTSDGKPVFGLGDINIKVTQILGNKGDLYYGANALFTFPTAGSALLGSGKWLADPGMGFIYFIPNKGGSASFIVDYNFSYAGSSTRPDVKVLGIAPNIDKWFKKGYIGYYGTWTYNFENKKWDIPLDIEAGYLIAKQFTFSAEYILPLLTNATYNNSWSLKLRYAFLMREYRKPSRTK